jgi:hypothetical protein
LLVGEAEGAGEGLGVVVVVAAQALEGDRGGGGAAVAQTGLEGGSHGVASSDTLAFYATMMPSAASVTCA